MNVLGDFNRKGRDIEVDFSLPAERVVRSLKQIIEWRGKPLAVSVCACNYDDAATRMRKAVNAIRHFRMLRRCKSAISPRLRTGTPQSARHVSG